MARIKEDLKDLNFENMDVFVNPNGPETNQTKSSPDAKDRKPVVAYSKHLCGVATDLSLRGLMNYVEAVPNHNLEGIVIACCCHQLVQQHTFPVPGFLKDLGFEGKEFERWDTLSECYVIVQGKPHDVPVVCRLRIVSSWRISGTGRPPASGVNNCNCKDTCCSAASFQGSLEQGDNHHGDAEDEVVESETPNSDQEEELHTCGLDQDDALTE